MTRIGRDLPPRPQREVVPELGLRSDFTSALSWGWDRAEVKPACAGTEWTAKREGWEHYAPAAVQRRHGGRHDWQQRWVGQPGPGLGTKR